MKNLTFILVSLGLILPNTGQAAGNRGTSDRTASDKQEKNPPSLMAEKGKDKADKSVAPALVKGTVIVVDPNAESITLADYVTGSNRTFLANKGDLINLRPGDRVNLTPQSGNSSRAHKVEKDHSERP